MKKMKNKREKGFTLIEMVVVIAIIAIIAGIATPQALGSINKAKITADVANAKSIANAIAQWQAEGTNSLGDTNGSWELVTSINGISTYISVPTSQKISGGNFYYKYDGTTLKIGAGTSSGTKYELYPSVDTTTTGSPYKE